MTPLPFRTDPNQQAQIKAITRARGVPSQICTPDLDVALGARIQAARVAAKISQGALGITFQQVQKYESDKDRIAASTLQGIVVALGVHFGSFFDADMSVPTGSIPDVKRALKSTNVLGQIRDPGVFNLLLALAEVLAEAKP